MGKRAVFLALDNSGWVSGQPGAALRAGLVVLYQRFAEFLAEPGNSLDLGVSLWGGEVLTRVYRDVDSVGLSLALSRVSEIDATFIGADFSTVAPDALSFFQGTLEGAEYESRKFIFLSAGAAAAGSDDAAAATLADLLDQSSGAFSTALGTSVDCHAANIDETTTTQVAKLDNTPGGVSVIFGGNNRAIAAYLRMVALPIERHRLWTFPIQWASGFDEDLAYRTEIIASRDGTEQRIGQRTKPRASYNFTSVLRSGRAQEALRRAGLRQGGRYFVQHGQGAARLAQAAPAGSTTIQIDGDLPGWVSPGSFIVLESSSGETTLSAIIRVTGQTVALAAPLEREHAVADKCRQGVEGRFERATEITLLTNTVGQTRTEFSADPVDTFFPDYGDAPVSLGGIEFFDLAPNWTTTPTITFEQESELFDEGRGAVDAIFPVAQTPRVVKFRYLCATPDKLNRVLGLFHRCKGRRNRFLMPLWADELRPLGDTPAGSTTLTFPGSEIAETFGPFLAYRRLLVRRLWEPDLILPITGVVVDGDGNSAAQLSAALEAALPLASVVSVMWVSPVRFASDQLSVAWQSDGVATIEINVLTLEEADVV